MRPKTSSRPITCGTAQGERFWSYTQIMSPWIEASSSDYAWCPARRAIVVIRGQLVLLAAAARPRRLRRRVVPWRRRKSRRDGGQRRAPVQTWVRHSQKSGVCQKSPAGAGAFACRYPHAWVRNTPHVFQRRIRWGFGSPTILGAVRGSSGFRPEPTSRGLVGRVRAIKGGYRRAGRKAPRRKRQWRLGIYRPFDRPICLASITLRFGLQVAQIETRQGFARPLVLSQELRSVRRGALRGLSCCGCLRSPLRRHACDCAFHDLQQRLLNTLSRNIAGD